VTAAPDASRNVKAAAVAVFQGVFPLAGVVSEAVPAAGTPEGVVPEVVSEEPPPPQPASAVMKTSAATRLPQGGVIVLKAMVSLVDGESHRLTQCASRAAILG
jgi:hypothetical protein